MQPRLRLFTGDDEAEAFPPVPTITISFGELQVILEDAVRGHRTWLRDFRNDDIQISEDLYEVLTEYSRMRPGA